MRYAILLPTEFDEKRNTLINIFTTWKDTISDYRKQYSVKDNESSHLWIWSQTLNQMLENLRSDRTSVHCFLLLDDNDSLQAISFCGESNKSEFYIHDFLPAPWNIKGSYFIAMDMPLSNIFDNIEAQLITFILSYCSSKSYSAVIYEPNFNWNTEKIADLFTQLQFEPSYRYISSIGLGFNGYKFNADKLREYRSYQFKQGVTFFSPSIHVKLLENYPADDNQSEVHLVKYNIH